MAREMGLQQTDFDIKKQQGQEISYPAQTIKHTEIADCCLSTRLQPLVHKGPGNSCIKELGTILGISVNAYTKFPRQMSSATPVRY